MNKREKLAQVLYTSYCHLSGIDPDPWADLAGAQSMWLRMADFGLSELREPDDRMLVAVRDWSLAKYGKPVGNEAATQCLQTMLDAISEDTKPPAPPEDDLTEKQRKATLRRAPLASWFG